MHLDCQDGSSPSAAFLHDCYWQTIDDWTLLPGSEVEIYDGDKRIDVGTVEAVTVDRSILWLKQDDAVLRRMVEKIPGRYIRVLSRDTGEFGPAS